MIPCAEHLDEIYLNEPAAEEGSQRITLAACWDAADSGYQADGEEGAGAARSAAMACLVQRRLAR